jgi:MarR family transcriptional regulator, organic hydroperoxide resistance regulator
MAAVDPVPVPREPSRDADLDRTAVISELSILTLPLMWSLRQEAMRVFEPLGLRPTRVLLLELVARGIDRPGTLADVLDAVPPAITAMLNELGGKGLLARETDPDDRRRTRLTLTPDGAAFLATARERWNEASRERIARLADDDLNAVLRAFRTLVREEPA